MRFAEFIVRRRNGILAASLVAVALALLPASRLAIVTDLVELLPSGSRAASDYAVFLERFGGLETVFVVVQAPPGADPVEAGDLVVEAADRLAEILEEDPEVEHARSGIDPEDEEFVVGSVLPRALLLPGGAPVARLEAATTPAALEARARELRSILLSPLGAAGTDLLAADPLGVGKRLLAAGPEAQDLPVDPASGAFLSADGRASLVMLTPSRAMIDPEGGRALARSLEAAYAAVREETGADLRFDALGGPLYAAHDEEVLREDLRATVGGATVGCIVLVVAAFGSLLLPLPAVVSVVAGVVATLALVRLGLGSISSVGVGFGAVLVGLGIDYGIHGTTRFLQCRADGDDPAGALTTTFRRAGPAIATSAFTTAAAFAVLLLAHLLPIRELGAVVAIGILALLVATALPGAASLVAIDAVRRSASPRGPVWSGTGRLVEATVDLATRRSGVVLAVALVATVAAGQGIARLRIEPDLQSMRPEHHPTRAAERALLAHFPVGLDTVTFVVTRSTLDEALDGAAEVASIVGSAGGDGVSVTSPTDWLGAPSVARERLRRTAELPLGAALSTFERDLREAGLDPQGFAPGLDALRSIAAGRDPGMAPPASWPDWIREQVRVDGDAASVAVRARLPGGAWADGPPAALVARLDREVGGVAIASAPAIAADLRRFARSDARRLGLWAVVLVVVVVWLSFRGSPTRTLLALAPVLLGGVWTLGFASLAGVPIDVFGIAVLPIVLGIGVDDGLHAVHGAERGRAGAVARSVVRSGRAMTLTTLTTMIGFGTLAFSHIPSLRRGGLVVAGGVLACLVATVVVLPAIAARTSRTP